QQQNGGLFAFGAPVLLRRVHWGDGEGGDGVVNRCVDGFEDRLGADLLFRQLALQPVDGGAVLVGFGAGEQLVDFVSHRGPPACGSSSSALRRWAAASRTAL